MGVLLRFSTPMEAGTLNCPMCGAASSSDASQCAHCGSRLATVACPSCFGLMFSGQRFCPHCGARAERQFNPLANPRKCPRCAVEMGALKLGPTDVCECPKCDGIWVETASFEKICAEREGEEPVATLGVAGSVPGPGFQEVTLERVRYIKCPECQTVMNRVNFARCSGVIIDVCREHGSWFDADELRRIIEFIRRGGLMTARLREIEELKAEKNRLTQSPGVGDNPTWHAFGPSHYGETRASLVVEAASALLDHLFS